MVSHGSLILLVYLTSMHPETSVCLYCTCSCMQMQSQGNHTGGCQCTCACTMDYRSRRELYVVTRGGGGGERGLGDKKPPGYMPMYHVLSTGDYVPV